MFKAIKNFFTHNLHINFMAYRRILLCFSGLLIIASVAGFVINGLSLSIEFQGGTSINFSNTGTITETEMRNAFDDAGVNDAVIQTSTSDESNGFIVRIAETDPTKANEEVSQVASTLEIDESDYQLTTIGPEWGGTVTNRSIIAFVASLLAIAIYIAVRFEWRMGVAAIASLIHDLVIVIGVYAISGYEVSPNVIAALLTIMGYSLYDSVVVFHRIDENSSPDMKCSVLTVTNDSLNQVFCRTLNTSITTFLPILVLLLFGGETLHTFAFAIAIGVILGPYSTIAISTPVYAWLKRHEPRFARIEERYPFEADTSYTTFRSRRAAKKAAKGATAVATPSVVKEEAPKAEVKVEKVAEPVEEPAVEEVVEEAAEPVEEPAVEEAAEEVAEPVEELAVEQAVEEVTEPADQAEEATGKPAEE
jgi:SecD/SecF fusion protein